MDEEDTKLKKFRKTNPFVVPENYFEELTKEVMGKLPEKEALFVETKKKVRWRKFRPWIYMAAMFIAILLPLQYWFDRFPEKQVYTEFPTVDTEIVGDEYIEAIVDDSMMDDYTLYRYLSDSDAESINY